MLKPLLLLGLVSCCWLPAACSTTMEISKRQWENCEKLCQGQLSKAGHDFLSSEKTCLCTNQVRFRYEGKRVSEEEEDPE